MSQLRYFLIYKPFGTLSQFTPEAGHPGLGELHNFPSDVYPVGRLDRDSEGLLFLTNDKRLNHRLLDPKYAHNRTYWAQVEGEATPEALEQLQRGVDIKHKGKVHRTRPAKARLLSPAPTVAERNPPIRFRKSVPDCWIELTLTEGKNRQVRKMCAAVGFPCLRLIRVAIGNLELAPLEVGKVTEWQGNKLLPALGLSPALD